MNLTCTVIGALRRWLLPAEQTRKRLVAIDVLRGIAILLVVGRHSPVELSAVHPAVAVPLRAWRSIGWTGVDLFFVLSGFLIGGLIMKEIQTTGRFACGRFLLRRGLKIWPGYYALVLATLSSKLLVQHVGVHEALYRIWPNLVHLQNYIRESPDFTPVVANYVTPISHSWSLSVEEHFYLCLALLMFALVRHRNALRVIPYLACGLTALCLYLRWQLHQLHPGASAMYWASPTHLRMDGLFFGVALAWLHRFHPLVVERVSRCWSVCLAAGLGLLAPVALTPLTTAFTCVYGLTFLYLGFGLCMVALVNGSRESRFLRDVFSTPVARAVAVVGFYSYSIYLWHVAVAQHPMAALYSLLQRHWSWGPTLLGVTMTVIYCCGAVGLGIILGRIIELPGLALRERLIPSEGKVAPALADAGKGITGGNAG